MRRIILKIASASFPLVRECQAGSTSVINVDLDSICTAVLHGRNAPMQSSLSANHCTAVNSTRHSIAIAMQCLSALPTGRVPVSLGVRHPRCVWERDLYMCSSTSYCAIRSAVSAGSDVSDIRDARKGYATVTLMTSVAVQFASKSLSF